MGEQCDLSLTDNQGSGTWYNVSSQDPAFSPRTAAAGAFLPPTNALYIFGGKFECVRRVQLLILLDIRIKLLSVNCMDMVDTVSDMMPECLYEGWR